MIAGLAQAFRTAAQKGINAHLSTWMTSYLRSLCGFPFLLAYLGAVTFVEGRGAPDFPAAYWVHCTAAALSQTMSGVTMILLFQRANFAVGTMLTKTDVMQAALIGSVLFSETISSSGAIGIALSVLGVLLISGQQAKAALGRMTFARALVSPSVGLGLATGFFFCLSYLFLREAALTLEDVSSFRRGAWTVVVVTGLQVVGIGIWLLATERREFAKLPALWRPAMFIGITSALGSIGWFTAMAMQNASYVKAVGQVEVVFTILISLWYFRERITLQEYAGMFTIVMAVLVFVL